MDKVINVFDLGPGDGGKGGIVHALSCQHRARVIFKVGGAQGSHGVKAGRNEFAFSQWGCGTFEGVLTHITPRMVISPVGLNNEADGLRYHGVDNAFDLLTIDERAICATPYHGVASRIKELARRSDPRGTIGTGVGEAYRDSTRHPELIIRAGDLRNDLRNKLSLVRKQIIIDLMPILEGSFLADDVGQVEREAKLLKDSDFLDYCTHEFAKVGQQAKIVQPDYIRQFFDMEGVGIVESSHGILTDNIYGFSPHTSAIRTLPSFTDAMLRQAGYQGAIERIGVHRAYSIRHGAGPLPTADPSMADTLLPGSHKEENRWQGKIRVGPLDFILLRYAVEVCGGPSHIDSLAISWFDQIATNGVWSVCDSYDNTDEEYFLNDRIRVNDNPALIEDYQQALCLSLQKCKPNIVQIEIPKSREGQFELCDNTLQSQLGVPVDLISFGPSEQDKLFKELVT